MEKMTTKNRTKIYRGISLLVRLALGVLFLFSGIVKAVDPMGTVYKLNDYLVAFGIEQFQFLTPLLSYILNIGEFTLGVLLLAGTLPRFMALLTLLFMGVMTPLTLYIAIANPVSDCGCFGDALILSNTHTFIKNVVLLVLAIVHFCLSCHIKPLYRAGVRWMVSLYTILFAFALSLIGTFYQPVLDFRPYKSGVSIREGMEIPEGAATDQYETILIYEKGGKQEQFTLQNYPVQDTTWHFVETINRLVKAGYRPPISEFSLYNELGDDVAPEILADSSYTFLLFAADLAHSSDRAAGRINEIYEYSQKRGYGFYGVTASGDQQIADWENCTGAEYPFLFMDEIAIKTVTRVNPTVALLHDGVLLWKRSYRNIPGEEELNAPLREMKWGELHPYNLSARLGWLRTIFFIPLLILLFIDKIALLFRRKKPAVPTQETNSSI